MNAVSNRASSRIMLLLVIAILVVLTIQGWTGDYVNLFSPFPSGLASHSIGEFIRALNLTGQMAVFHASEALILGVLSIWILINASRPTSSRGVRVWSVVGFLAIVSAIIGGSFFVSSGFQNNAASAQMGGSFIGAYASYFLALYSTKTTSLPEQRNDLNA